MARSRDNQTFVESEINFSDHEVPAPGTSVRTPELAPWPLFFARGVAVFTEAQHLPHLHVHNCIRLPQPARWPRVAAWVAGYSRMGAGDPCQNHAGATRRSPGRTPWAGRLEFSSWISDISTRNRSRPFGRSSSPRV